MCAVHYPARLTSPRRAALFPEGGYVGADPERSAIIRWSFFLRDGANAGGTQQPHKGSRSGRVLKSTLPGVIVHPADNEPRSVGPVSACRNGFGTNSRPALPPNYFPSPSPSHGGASSASPGQSG